ncbi:unnamed protein product [Notodromas monacha]|uniref:Uncharacterized protein n=1 Tax=Notodromas monacha TaxID=399045 RepID=A0A7R9BZZ3_9CRUS|nr:unnamed protein product [Notodromas monacha]CAG0924785.1 unnamed protein product [Notodromas monacha]
MCFIIQVKMDLGRVISRFILPSLILATTSLGQQGLNSFAEIKENLEGGRRLQMNAFADHCESTTPTDLSMPLRHWQIVTENGETTVRANDFSVLPGRSELSFIVRELNIFANGTVKVDIIVPVQITETYSVTCVLGRGAFVHRVDFGADVEQLVSYDEIKTGLLLGKHIEAVGTLHKCYNYQEVLGDTELTVGFLVSNIAVLNDGDIVNYLLKIYIIL